ncbi:MAG: hypothetical protein JW864_08270 [Spirochaetes bacterium]|nr:hypothetical protein [Spirochaetota bacterium]
MKNSTQNTTKHLPGLISICFFIFILLFNSALYASKPLAAVTGVKSGNVRVLAVSAILEDQLINVVNTTGIFDLINSGLLKEQLVKHGCIEEECVLAFAKTAKINLIFRGFVYDKGSSIQIQLLAQGIDYPYFGKIVYQYTAGIPVKGLNLTAAEYKYICEEHAGYFISDCLREYKSLTYIKTSKDNNTYIDSDFPVNGKFTLYRFEESPEEKDLKKAGIVGSISVSGKNITITNEEIQFRENDFILISFDRKADFLEKVYYGRKRELVFNGNSSADTAIMIFSTVPLSVLMPVAAPLAYYRNSDYYGLGLWALNTLPYLYLEYDGFKNRPNTYEDSNSDIPGKSRARFRFGIYMCLAGGIPLIIDAFSNQMHYLAQSYQGTQPYVGHTASAIYLSLISGGGGLFYKGYRYHGYAYFHLHNFLLYSFLKEMSPGKSYNEQKGTYTKDSINRKKAYTWLGAFTLLKIFEITHVSLIRDNIKNGKQIDKGFAFEPVIYDYNNDINIGIQYTFSF